MKKRISAHCGRVARAKRKFRTNRSVLRQDGSNELSHAQIRTPASKTDRTKHLLLYRYIVCQITSENGIGFKNYVNNLLYGQDGMQAHFFFSK